MMELPKMYHSVVNNIDNQVQKVYSTIGKHDDVLRKSYSHVSIDKKIDDIFRNKDFVYKADVVIVTDNDSFRKRVVARNSNYLVTIDNEYIPINTIRDIYK